MTAHVASYILEYTDKEGPQVQKFLSMEKALKTAQAKVREGCTKVRVTKIIKVQIFGDKLW